MITLQDIPIDHLHGEYGYRVNFSAVTVQS